MSHRSQDFLALPRQMASIIQPCSSYYQDDSRDSETVRHHQNVPEQFSLSYYIGGVDNIRDEVLQSYNEESYEEETNHD